MIVVGTAGWNIPRVERDRFASEGSGLQRYASRLNAAEINTSFYRSHAVSTYERWAASVPRGFRFAVKIPKAITHEHALLRSREPLTRFVGEIAGLGAALGEKGFNVREICPHCIDIINLCRFKHFQGRSIRRGRLLEASGAALAFAQ